MPRILVVDDEEELVKTMKAGLETAGYEVLTAYDGRDGFEKACSERPDLIILDLVLPRMDGYRVCNTLKCDNRYKKIPIIILTVRGKDLDLEKIVAREFGADAYLTKPVEPRILLAKIQELLA